MNMIFYIVVFYSLTRLVFGVVLIGNYKSKISINLTFKKTTSAPFFQIYGTVVFMQFICKLQ